MVAEAHKTDILNSGPQSAILTTRVLASCYYVEEEKEEEAG